MKQPQNILHVNEYSYLRTDFISQIYKMREKYIEDYDKHIDLKKKLRLSTTKFTG